MLTKMSTIQQIPMVTEASPGISHSLIPDCQTLQEMNKNAAIPMHLWCSNKKSPMWRPWYSLKVITSAPNYDIPSNTFAAFDKWCSSNRHSSSVICLQQCNKPKPKNNDSLFLASSKPRKIENACIDPTTIQTNVDWWFNTPSYLTSQSSGSNDYHHRCTRHE